MSIQISYGINNSVTKSVEEFPTVSSVLAHDGLKQFLGFGENSEARVNGVLAASDMALADGDVVSLSSKANTKG